MILKISGISEDQLIKMYKMGSYKHRKGPKGYWKGLKRYRKGP